MTRNNSEGLPLAEITKQLLKIKDDYDKSVANLDETATSLMAALQAFHERLERIEEWILHQKSQPAK